jgi:type IV secretory pathway TrbL component
MEGALQIFDALVAGFLSAIATGGGTLARYGIGLLSILFLFSYMREFGAKLATGVGSLSDALGTPLLYFIMVGSYMYILSNLIPMTTAALNTAVGWGLEMSGGSIAADLMRKPSFIVQAGLDVAKPIAQFDTMWNAIKSTIGLAAHPQNLLVFWVILLSFMASAIHFGMTIIEFSLSVSLTYVLLPWGIWVPARSVGEFAVGWVLGGLVRVLVSCSIVGISVPLFGLLLQEPQGFIDIANVVIRLVGSLFFGAIALAVPGKAANWASRAGLALSGSTVLAGAMTFARFSLIGTNVIRGFSQLIGR